VGLDVRGEVFILEISLGLEVVVWLGNEGNGVAGRSQRSTKSIAFLVLLTGLSWSGVQAPLGLEWLVDLLRLSELKVANLLGDGGALSSGLEPRDKLGLEAAGLLGVQVTGLLRDINKGCDDLIVALLFSLLSDTASTADLNGQLLTLGVSDKLTRLLLNVLGGARRFIDSSALLRALTIANLLEWPVAFLDGLIESLLLEGDLTSLLEVLLANLLLSRRELCDIGVVTLLNILVCAFKDGVLLDGLDGLFLLNTAESSLGIILAGTEVYSSLNLHTILASPSELLTAIAANLR